MNKNVQDIFIRLKLEEGVKEIKIIWFRNLEKKLPVELIWLPHGAGVCLDDTLNTLAQISQVEDIV
jgi:hypothetical protein